MAEMVGSALLSGLFNVLFERLATEEVKNFLRPKTVINKLLKKLEVLLLSANKLLADAEKKQIKDDLVKKWHNELKDVVCKADELADKIETEVLRLKMEENQSASESSFYEDLTNMFTTLLSNPLGSFDNYVKDELEEILSSLEHLLSQKDALGLEPAGKSNYSGVKTRVSERSRPTPVADESGFCGRKDIKETIIQSLLSAEGGGDKVSVIPVIGAGGLGKTTLVQIIYDHPEVKQLFEGVRAWVTVSTEFDLPTITKTIIEKIVDPSPIKGNEDQQELLFKLRDVLKGKKFLLVLDDVWSEDRGKWNTLKSCFKSAESGSNIIVTTRSAKVASVMAPNQQCHLLQELPEKDCLKLFAQTVFGDDQDLDAYPDWQEIGKKIVSKCKGNPLSVVTVGGILCGERHMEEWEKILESSLWELLQKDSEDIIPSLWLSYLYLPSEIKPCFAYCSIFPKDYLFRKEVVVQLWMAEGFLQNEAGKRRITMEEVGKQYFEELISRSLFQRSKVSVERFIMHDLVHDLAINVSGEFCFCSEGEKNLRDLSCKTRYLLWNKEVQDVKIFEGLSKAKRLHSFFGLRPSTQTGDILKVLEELAIEGRCLRVLSLSSVGAMKSLPDSIGDLKHLRYLNLSCTGVEKLPDSVGTLYNLQTLILSYCSKLTQLPDSIGNLKHLRDLDLSGTGVEKLPDSVGTLYDLQTLLLSGCSKLTQLPDSIGNLKHMRDLDLFRTAVEKLPDSVGTLYDLQTLLLSGCSKLTQLPDSIGNLKHLRDLDLSGTGVEKLPDSVGTLYDLQTLLLSYCSKLTQLPDSIGNLKHLRDLDLSRTAVEKLPDSVGTLYDLQTLLLSGCSKLTQLPDSIGNLKHLRDLDLSRTAVEKLPDSVGTLYDLQTLLLSGCSKLTQLPDSIGNLKHLRDLDLSGTGVEKLPDSVGTLYDLQMLLLSGCSKLTQLRDSIGALKHLRDLDLSDTAVEKLPDSVGTLYDLQTLLLSGCSKLTQLPDSIGNLKHLRDLNLSRTGVEKLPDSVGTLYDLQTLLLSGCSKLTQLPDSIGNLKHLRDLNSSRTEVEKLLDSVGTLYDLQTLLLSGCSKLTQLPDSIGNLKHLRDLDLSGTGVEKLPDSVGTLYDLQTLLLSGCSKLTQLPDSIGNLKHLRDLNLSRTAVEKLPDSVGTLYDLQTLLLSGCSKLTQLPDSIGNLKHLRDLDLSRTAVEKLPDSVGTLYDLQTLLLSGCSKLTQLPDSIGNLKHLRDLNLSMTWLNKLPDSVGTLYNLQTLLLSKCHKLTQLPSNLGKLTNLRHLDTRETPLEEMPPDMCNLTKLQILNEFVVGKGGSSIRDLGALHDLNGELRISGLQTVDDVLKGNLEDKKNLSKLVLQWKVQTDDSRDSRKEKTVLDALQPHANLKKLLIYGYGGTSFPDWLGDSLFSKIEEMRLNGCQDCLFLPSLGRLSSLKELKMKGFHKLETIDDEFYDNDSPFKSLEVLHFSDMPELKRWSVIEVPRLKELKLKGCPKLVGGLPNCKTLTTLRIDRCPKIEYSGNQCRYPSLESLEIRQSCCYIRRLSLEHLTKLNKLVLTELDWLVELTGESSNEVKRLFIEKCPKLEFLGNSRYGSLENLKIGQCEALNSIPLDYFPKLNKLTLRYCQNFESFRFGEEPPLVLESLKKLKLKGLPKFVSFPEGGLPAPNLKDFYIKKCENLRALPQQMPRLLPSLKSLEVTYCGRIKWWPDGGLPSNLESLEISGCKKLAAQVMHWDLQVTCLKSFTIDGRGEELLDSFPPEGLLPTSLTSLSISGFQGLKTLNIHAFQHLKKLYVISCGEIESWPEGGLPSNLESLAIWECKKLAAQVMHWDLQVTCLKTLEIDGCGEELLDSFPPEGLLATSLTTLKIHNFRRLKTLNIHAFQHLDRLNVENCDDLQCLPEESLPNSLSFLDIYNCPLLERRYRKETGEGWHKISHIPKVRINWEVQH